MNYRSRLPLTVQILFGSMNITCKWINVRAYQWKPLIRCNLFVVRRWSSIYHLNDGWHPGFESFLERFDVCNARCRNPLVDVVVSGTAATIKSKLTSKQRSDCLLAGLIGPVVWRCLDESNKPAGSLSGQRLGSLSICPDDHEDNSWLNILLDVLGV